MKTIALVSCSAMKADHPRPAEQLYVSPLFKMSLAFARKQKPDAVYVLSALHGLVKMDQTLEPYDQSFLKAGKEKREAWAKSTLKQLEEVADLANDKFIFMTGVQYYQDLLPRLAHYELPLKGLGLGARMAFLKSEL